MGAQSGVSLEMLKTAAEFLLGPRAKISETEVLIPGQSRVKSNVHKARRGGWRVSRGGDLQCFAIGHNYDEDIPGTNLRIFCQRLSRSR
jgi:hypothetical protein